MSHVLESLSLEFLKNRHCFQEENKIFFERKRFDKESFHEQAKSPVDQIVLFGFACSGTSSLLRNLETMFPDHTPVSGGDYQRAIAGKGNERALHALMNANLEDPSKGTDRACDTFIRYCHLTEKKRRIDARVGPATTEGRAFYVYVNCRDDLRAERILLRMREETKPGDAVPILADAWRVMKTRDTNDVLRFSKLYPGSIWPKEDFHFVIDTSCHNQQSTARIVGQAFQHWRERMGFAPMEVQIPDELVML